MAIVYAHINPINNSIYYIGIGNDLKRAYRNEGRNNHWTRVYNKYGKIVDILANDISIESAREMEKFLIQSIGIKNLCNQTLGGEGFFGGKHSDKTKEKFRQNNLGKKLSDETKAKIGAKSKGHPNYNPTHTEEAKRKISMAFKGKKRSEYFCQQVKKSKINYRPTEEAIKMGVIARKEKSAMFIELTTNYKGKIWDVEKHFNIDRRAIYYNCQRNKPIEKGMGKGLQFQKLTA